MGTSRYEVSSWGGVFTVFRFPHAASYGLSFDATRREVNAISPLLLSLCEREAIKGVGAEDSRCAETNFLRSVVLSARLSAQVSCRVTAVPLTFPVLRKNVARSFSPLLYYPR